MTEWRIKEISDLTQTSVRMLRHYDKIGLLKPSYRSENGYRCYTAKDLATLQQIIALRYFGFNLSTVKSILQKHHNIYAHLQAQQQVLKEQSAHLQQVNDALGGILKRLSPSETPNWNDLTTLIEGYRMSENLRDKLKKTWAGQELNESQFEEYLFLYEQFPEEFAMQDKITEQVNNNELGDPAGPDGERVVRFTHDFAKKLKAQTAQQMKLGASILASLQSGKLSSLQATPEAINWFSRAHVSYWLKRWNSLYDTIVENVKSDPQGKVGKKVAEQWTGLIDDHFSSVCRPLAIGMILWQEIAKQDDELTKESTGSKAMPSVQELAKRMHVKLMFNPEAISWISQALTTHAK